jgi:hypothetical protein
MKSDSKCSIITHASSSMDDEKEQKELLVDHRNYQSSLVRPTMLPSVCHQ